MKGTKQIQNPYKEREAKEGRQRKRGKVEQIIKKKVRRKKEDKERYIKKEDKERYIG